MFVSALLRKVLILDSIIYSCIGILLFFWPHFVGDFFLFWQRTTDGVHWHLLRCVGGQLLGSAFLSWRASSKRCMPELRSACFLLRLLSAILCSFLFIHIRSVNPTFLHPVVLRSLIWFSLGTVFLSFFLLLISGWPIGNMLYPENHWGNILYQLDTIAATSIGLAWVLAPEWLLHRQVRVTLDLSHEFCGRLMGLFFISSQMISGHALHWPQRSDRAMAAETRAILCLFILTAQIWSQMAYHRDWSDKHWVGISLFSSWTALAIIYRGYLWLAGADTLLSEGEKKKGTMSTMESEPRAKKYT